MFAMPAFTRNTFEAHSPTTTFPFSSPLFRPPPLSYHGRLNPLLRSLPPSPPLRSCPCVGERKRRKRYEVIYNRGGGREEGGEVLVEASPHFHPPLPSLSRSSLSAGENNKGVGGGGGGGGRRERREGRHHHKSCWKFPPPFPLPLLSFFFGA